MAGETELQTNPQGGQDPQMQAPPVQVGGEPPVEKQTGAQPQKLIPENPGQQIVTAKDAGKPVDPAKDDSKQKCCDCCKCCECCAGFCACCICKPQEKFSGEVTVNKKSTDCICV